MRARRLTALALAGILAATGAACGDDGGTTEEPEASGSASGTEDTTTTTEEEETSDTTEGASGDEAVPSFDDLGECLEIAGAYAGLGMILLGGTFGSGEEVDVDAVIADVEAIAADAPGDVEDAFGVVIDSYEQVFADLGDDLSALDFTDPATAEALEPLSSPEFTAANEEVSAYLTELCES